LLLARALYIEPSVLALDEATSHLDLDNEKAVSLTLKSLNVTRIVIAHRPETIAGAQRRIHLSANGMTTSALTAIAPSLQP
jgi:ATP-binding cassette subfamily B protein RaxB